MRVQTERETPANRDTGGNAPERDKKCNGARIAMEERTRPQRLWSNTWLLGPLKADSAASPRLIISFLEGCGGRIPTQGRGCVARYDGKTRLALSTRLRPRTNGICAGGEFFFCHSTDYKGRSGATGLDRQEDGHRGGTEDTDVHRRHAATPIRR